MGQQTKIEWCDHTFNAWIGCTKVAPECANCYAKTLMDDRYGRAKWGPRGTRVITSAANWELPRKWDRAAAKAGVKRAVFCASLADVFEDNRPATGGEDRGVHDLDGARAALWRLIESTPHLVWLLLTKRPQNINAMVPPAWLERWPENVWTGGSAGCQATADAMIPPLLGNPGPHFLSCEPMLGAVDLTRIDASGEACESIIDALAGCVKYNGEWLGCGPSERIHWVICGGESGPNARPMHPDWARGLRDQCAAAGVPFLFKQWGEWLPHSQEQYRGAHYTVPRHRFDEDNLASRVGKKAAGRMLDGVEHNALPWRGEGRG